jgi:ABC-type Mn2+/Zn2+ transport system permease subunit
VTALDWLVEPFRLAFMQRALVGGLLTVVVTALVGTWVVLRGLSFLGDALAHGVVPGIALGVVMGFDPSIGAVVSALVMAGGISLVHRVTRLREDTGIGLLFVGMLALGVVILSRSPAYTGSLTGILFGNLLGVTVGDLVLLAAAAGLTLAASALLYRGLLALAFNQQKAEVLGLRPRLTHLALMGLVTLAVVTSLRTVGTLLVFGLLVAPPATAVLVARRVPTVMATAVALGMLAVVGGLVVSYHAGTAASATVAGISVGFFFVVLLGRSLTAAVRA